MGFINIYNVDSIADEGTKITDWLNFLCVAIGSVIAIYGINSWRRESRWKVKTAVKEEILTILYELKDIIVTIRSNYQHRIDTIPEGKLDEIYYKVDSVKRNWDAKHELFSKFQSKKYAALAVLNKSLLDHFNKLIRVINEINASARNLQDIYYPALNNTKTLGVEQLRAILTSTKECENIVFKNGENDEYEQKVNKIIDDFIDAINKS